MLTFKDLKRIRERQIEEIINGKTKVILATKYREAINSVINNLNNILYNGKREISSEQLEIAFCPWVISLNPRYILAVGSTTVRDRPNLVLILMARRFDDPKSNFFRYRQIDLLEEEELVHLESRITDLIKDYI